MAERGAAPARGDRSAVWRLVWGGVALLGVCFGFLLWPPAAVILGSVAAVLVTGVVLALWARARRQSDPTLPTPAGRELARDAVFVGLSLVALRAVGTASTPLALLLLLTALASSPSAWCLARDRWRQAFPPSEQSAQPETPARSTSPPPPAPTSGHPSPGSTYPHPLPPGDRVRDLSNQELCRLWRSSFVTLQRAQLPSQVAQIVLLRQVYLDEMDRRDPVAVRAWLAAGARAAGGPDRYLRDEGPGGQAQAA